MSKVIADITMSLDGYVAPPSANFPHGGTDVDELQAWVMEQAQSTPRSSNGRRRRPVPW